MNPYRTHGVPRRPSAALARIASGAPPAILALAVMLVSTVAVAADDPPRVRLGTSLGDIVLELDPTRAPASVANFLDYVDADFYDGTVFHRVIEGFMIQGGGFDERFSRRPTGAPIRNEADNGLANRRYTISMARTNAPHSATAQFFINTVDNPNLDHTGANPRGWGYAVFGRVVDGHDVVDAISRVPTGPGGPFPRDAPRDPIVIETAERVPPVAGDAASDTRGTLDTPVLPRPDDARSSSAASETAAPGDVEPTRSPSGAGDG